MSEPYPDLLQGLECALEQIRRLSQVAQQLIDAMQRGQRLPDAMLADYATQLRNVAADNARMDSLIQAFWQMHGHDGRAQ